MVVKKEMRLAEQTVGMLAVKLDYSSAGMRVDQMVENSAQLMAA